jgi:hypothetical protein
MRLPTCSENRSLLDPVLTRNAPERNAVLAERFDIVTSPACDLRKCSDTSLLEDLLLGKTDPLHQGQIFFRDIYGFLMRCASHAGKRYDGTHACDVTLEADAIDIVERIVQCSFDFAVDLVQAELDVQRHDKSLH